MASLLSSQPPSPPIYLCFQQLSHAVYMNNKFPKMVCKKDGKILLKTQHQFIVQFHEYNTIHVHKMYKNKCRGKIIKLICTLKILLFPDFFQRLKFSLTWSETPWLFSDLEEIFFP